LEAWTEFGRGPLFRLAFALMVLGLARILLLTAAGVVEALRRNPDRIVAWRDTANQTLAWLFPLRRLWASRPIYSVVSFVFHAGLLLVPVFLGAHILLWKGATGVSWPLLPQVAADWLSLTTAAAALALFLGRVLHRGARALSRLQDYAWPLLLAIPFITGYICSNVVIAPETYQALMLIHIYAGNLIMAMIPFTKIAHCALLPLSQVVTSVAWKFPAGAGDKIAATLGHADHPSWAARGRAGVPAPRKDEVLAR
jgi:nitrate reductase gamma subunit